jgi:UDP-N-acetylmuramoyl-L-alanyl-D-glutamate--2,6-diaminopimelate ligase
METSRTLHELGEAVGGHVIGAPETAVSHVTHDSRQIGEGTLYVAISGAIHDGHDFALEAAEAGAVALCVERELPIEIAQLIVGNTRQILGQLAAEIYGHPSHSIDVIGVTGTNGKTTVAHFIESIMDRAGFATGRIGTVGNAIKGKAVPSVRTTPEATEFQALLATMRDDGVEKVAVEVSSHALELGRVSGTRFAVAAFTNLSQDHLDFHRTMEAYRAAKARLFAEYEVETAVFNIDDPAGSNMSSSYAGAQLTVGSGGDFAAEGVATIADGSEFQLHAPGFNRRLSAPVYGSFNVSNLLVAVACCFAAGAELDVIIDALSGVDAVPGRFEIVSREDDPLVVVDYAHTPEGISLAIETARSLRPGRVIAVVGAGGDRDRAKRRPMGAAASSADLVVVTSDNPRNEDPDEIIDAVMEGVSAASVRQADRLTAIEKAITTAEQNDVVLILGKGHEQGQESKGAVAPFDDRAVARNQLKLWRKSANFGDNSGSMGA